MLKSSAASSVCVQTSKSFLVSSITLATTVQRGENVQGAWKKEEARNIYVTTPLPLTLYG